MRVGLIGAGAIAARHAETLRGAGERLVAVADVDRGAAERLAAPWGASVHEEWETLLDRERLDAVLVCTPPRLHAAPALAALERGVAVFVEKPIARSQEDGEAIATAARRRGAVCAVGYQWRAIAWLEPLRRELAGERIGLLAGRGYGGALPRPWFLRRADGGGQILERASHTIDLQRAIAGEVTAVQAAGARIALRPADARPEHDVEDVVSLQLALAGGGLATVQVAWTPSGRGQRYVLDVVGAEAELELLLDPAFRARGSIGGRPVELADEGAPIERGLRRFLAAAREHDPDAVACTPRDALGTLAVALACEQALASGGTVAVPALSSG